MDEFLEMQTFAEVVDAGSFVKAADTLPMSKAAVSRYVGDLESRLGVRLEHRTTRRLSLTEEGQVFYARCRALLAELGEVEAEITSGSADASGLVRVNAPLTFGTGPRKTNGTSKGRKVRSAFALKPASIPTKATRVERPRWRTRVSSCSPRS